MTKFESMVYEGIIALLKTYCEYNGEINIENFHQSGTFDLSFVEYDEEEIAYPVSVTKKGIRCTAHEREAWGDQQETFIISFDRLKADYLRDIVDFIIEDKCAK